MKELLQFAGHALAYSFNLYARSIVEPDTLCLVAVKRDNHTSFLTFEGDSIGICHESARKMLFEMEDNGGYEMAVIVFDGYIKDPEQGTRQEALLAQVFTLDTFANRRAAYCYTRQKNMYVPVSAPGLYGDWDYTLPSVDKTFLAEGMQQYFKSIGSEH